MQASTHVPVADGRKTGGRLARSPDSLAACPWTILTSRSRRATRLGGRNCSAAALTRALDDEHPQVRRKAVHSLSCEQCKPNSCVVDVRPLFERVIGDRSRLVRSMVLHVCSLHFLGHQWAIDLVARVAAADPSAKLRASAEVEIRHLRERWESDDRRRDLPGNLVRKTERHAGRWVVIRDGRIAAVGYGRELEAGASRYWVAPTDARRPQIP